MCADDGTWLKPPPPWPLINGGTVGLMDYLCRARQGLEWKAISSLLLARDS
jgi:hypothetical protein